MWFDLTVSPLPETPAARGGDGLSGPAALLQPVRGAGGRGAGAPGVPGKWWEFSWELPWENHGKTMGKWWFYGI